MTEITFKKEFVYDHRKNPYDERLADFSEFVFRDHESEKFAGKWNSDLFKKNAALFAEIGSGYGEFMIEYCKDHPDHNFVGMDYRFKRSFSLAKKLAAAENKNFRYLRAKGERIHFIFSESELDGLFYFFPDPWPKTRHHKKRLFQHEFLKIASFVLKEGGTFFIKTDHDGYAEHMSEVIAGSKEFKVALSTKDLRAEFPDHFLSRYTTKFEKIFLSHGTKIKAFVLINTKGK